jgi:hypothetical protein
MMTAHALEAKPSIWWTHRANLRLMAEKPAAGADRFAVTFQRRVFHFVFKVNVKGTTGSKNYRERMQPMLPNEGRSAVRKSSPPKTEVCSGVRVSEVLKRTWL